MNVLLADKAKRKAAREEAALKVEPAGSRTTEGPVPPRASPQRPAPHTGKQKKEASDADDEKHSMLCALNKVHAHVIIGDNHRIMKRRRKGFAPVFWRQDTFTSKYANKMYAEYDDSGKPKFHPITLAWLRWSDRKDYDEIVFEPDESKVSAEQCNLWNGFPVEGKQGNWSLLEHHIRDTICQGNEAHYLWFKTWMANIFQCPGEKPGSAVGVRGKKGSGKSIVFDFLRLALGFLSLKVSRRDSIVGGFNAHQSGKLFMACEECWWKGDSAIEGILKDLITGQDILTTPKGLDSFMTTNFMRLAFVSNEEWFVPAGMENERRFLVLECGSERVGDLDFFKKMAQQMNKEGGLAAMVWDLTHWVPPYPNGWDALRKPPQTEALIAQGLQGQKLDEKFVLEAVINGRFVGVRDPDIGEELSDIWLDGGTTVPYDYDVEAVGNGTRTTERRQGILIECQTLQRLYAIAMRQDRYGSKDYVGPGKLHKLLVRMVRARAHLPQPRNMNQKRCFLLPTLDDMRTDLAGRHMIDLQTVEDIGAVNQTPDVRFARQRLVVLIDAMDGDDVMTEAATQEAFKDYVAALRKRPDTDQ
jgi:hypothetical protein